SFRDYLSGGSGNVRIYGGQSGSDPASADVIYGGTGNDYIDPGPGRKYIWCGTGVVTLVDYRGVDRNATLPPDFDPATGDTLIPVQTGAGTTPDIGPFLAGPPVVATQQKSNAVDLIGDPGQNNFNVANSVARIGTSMSRSTVGRVSLMGPNYHAVSIGASDIASASQAVSNAQTAANDIIDTGAEINAVVTAQFQAMRIQPKASPVGLPVDQQSAAVLPSDPMLGGRQYVAISPGLAKLIGVVDPQFEPPAQMSVESAMASQVPDDAAAQTDSSDQNAAEVTVASTDPVVDASPDVNSAASQDGSANTGPDANPTATDDSSVPENSTDAVFALTENGGTAASDCSQAITDTLPPADGAGNVPFSFGTDSTSFAVADAGNVDSVVGEQASTSEYLSYLNGELDTAAAPAPVTENASTDSPLDQAQINSVDAPSSLNQMDGSAAMLDRDAGNVGAIRLV
ncbi:MAG TPA: hypothetical protein VGZ47_02870, partial [Gemmataceae bacterium]|nr:hypothetical protein [Gemmataceae bacterium]